MRSNDSFGHSLVMVECLLQTIRRQKSPPTLFPRIRLPNHLLRAIPVGKVTSTKCEFSHMIPQNLIATRFWPIKKIVVHSQCMENISIIQKNKSQTEQFRKSPTMTHAPQGLHMGNGLLLSPKHEQRPGDSRARIEIAGLPSHQSTELPKNALHPRPIITTHAVQAVPKLVSSSLRCGCIHGKGLVSGAL